jgi:alkaline phosphatase
VFAGMSFSIEQTKDADPQLVVSNADKTLVIPAYSSVGLLNGVSFELGSVAVYVDKTNTFYLPKKLVDKMK